MMSNPLQFDYVHRDLEQEVTAIGGHYRFDREARLAFSGQQVLYLVGHALFDCTCCGVGGCGYALVQGLVEKWKYRRDAEGYPVSRVAEIAELHTRKEITRRIQAQETVQQVVFRTWLSDKDRQA